MNHCPCCVRSQGFGLRRLRVYLLLLRHPEMDETTFHGELYAQADRGDMVRGMVTHEVESHLELIRAVLAHRAFPRTEVELLPIIEAA